MSIAWSAEQLQETKPAICEERLACLQLLSCSILTAMGDRLWGPAAFSTVSRLKHLQH